MANVKIENIPEETRSAVELIAHIGGFGDDYYSVQNTQFKDEMFLYNLNGAIENKRYKSVIGMLKNEYPFMNFEKENGVVSEDEKLLRRGLRAMGYNDDNFFNPKYDKGDLIVWNDPRDNKDHLYKIKTNFIDSGAYYYSLTNLDTGVETGGRLREDELREPTVLEKIQYYKKQGMLDVHLFNYNVPLDKVTKEDALALLEALKGIDIEHDKQDIREIAYVAQKGFVDMNTHFNVLAMIADSSDFLNNPIPLKLPTDNVSIDEIKTLDALAKNNVENLDKYKTISSELSELKKELKYQIGLNPESTKALNEIKDSLHYMTDRYDTISSTSVGEIYGNAHWTIRNSHPEIYKKVESLYEKTLEFTQNRDIHKLNRPDLNELIKDANLQLDLSREDKVLFRGSRDSDYDYGDIKVKMDSFLTDSAVAELNVANNGFRREFYQAPSKTHGGSNFGYCEGDLTLCVPKNKEDFQERLSQGIRFYVEDEFVDNIEERVQNIESEMFGKLGLLSAEQILNEEVAKIDAEAEQKQSQSTRPKLG